MRDKNILTKASKRGIGRKTRKSMEVNKISLQDHQQELGMINLGTRIYNIKCEALTE